ncbi:TPA: GNAT family N-acetyltransferase [Legionella pneumophila]|nr:GNAT family N-acetyltransferase [Legionella pneumophila]
MSTIINKSSNRQEKPDFISKLEKTWSLRLLTADDADEVKPFIALFNDFFQLCEGEYGSWDGILKACPPFKDIHRDKFVLGLYYEYMLIGLLDLIRDYPQAGIWTIGYLLVHPKHQRKGLGSKFIKDLETALRPSTMRCVVQKQNARALYFWQNNGFLITSQTQETLGRLENLTYVLEK